jgi:SAM-dependent methyltransferase
MFKKQNDYSINKDKMGGAYVSNSDIEMLVPSNCNVLDIGCTTGKLAKFLKKRGCKVTGVDIDDGALLEAKKHCIKTYKIDLDDLDSIDRKLKGQKYDCITMGDILEHIKYPGILLYHLKKYLKPKGTVIASIPNSAFVWMRFRFLFGNFDYSNKGGLMDEDHLRFFSFKTAKILFEDAHYNILSLKESSHGIVNPAFGFIKYLAKIFPTLFAIHIIVLAQNKR